MILITGSSGMGATVEHGRLYSLSEARRFLTSPRGGPVCLRTLHRWRKEGRFEAVARRSGARTYWFVRGSELLRLLGDEARPARAARPRPTGREGEDERALRTLRALGYEV